MADPVQKPIGDDTLAAYLDEELSAEERRDVDAALLAEPDLRARLSALQASNRPFKEAFDLVLPAAPTERLAAALRDVTPPRAETPPPRRVWMGAAAVVLFAAGVAVGTINPAQRITGPAPVVVADNSSGGATAPTLQRPAEISPRVATTSEAAKIAAAPAPSIPPVARLAAPTADSAAPPVVDRLAGAQPNAAGAPAPASSTPPPAGGGTTWRQLVADYIGLTTPDTLSATPPNPRLWDDTAEVGKRLQLDLTPDNLALPAASVRDVRLYDYRGRPLVEVAYLSDDMLSVVALCIIISGAADAPLAFEQRSGQNIVYWTAGGRGFMIAGKAPRETLEMIARQVALRFS